MTRVFLIMSLNNPISYHFTRHNVGSWWIRYFCLLNDIQLQLDSKFQANIAYIKYNDIQFFVLEPLSYINCAGGVLSKFLSFYSVDPKCVLIIHDDLDLQVGDIKLKFSGGNSGHNGLHSISSVLKTSCFFRLRIGVGVENGCFSKKEYVLSEPNFSDKIGILLAIKVSLFFIDDILNLNFSSFRNKINNFFCFGENNG